MSKRYIVPEGMRKAAWAAHAARGYRREDYCVCAEIAVEAALIYLAENPIVPSASQCDELYELPFNNDDKAHNYTRAVATEWQRRMFLAPEPKTPQPIDTPLGRVVFDPRVPKGEIHIGSWDRPLIMGNIGTDK